MFCNVFTEISTFVIIKIIIIIIIIIIFTNTVDRLQP